MQRKFHGEIGGADNSRPLRSISFIWHIGQDAPTSLSRSFLDRLICFSISDRCSITRVFSLDKTHHFYDFHHGVDTEVIEERGQVFLHLDAVVVQLGHGEDAHLALPPNLVLSEKEGQQHQHASVVDDPPDVDVTLGEALSVGREGGDVLGDEQSQLRGQDTSTALCFRPPSPLAWRRWEVASRRLEDTVT
ncbi:hypothetical protein EYF80_013365 [Liparis tanakae]|uniref:Uncharacterized protein n=1 Tax=Liparis tanakae TaxID=230148 RepID=A0A4Z2IF28_9TELE|nr:hypothetical protein EYF80_013365 [Liparis tanakae]